jgi:hypothetical protein
MLSKEQSAVRGPSPKLDFDSSSLLSFCRIFFFLRKGSNKRIHENNIKNKCFSHVDHVLRLLRLTLQYSRPTKLAAVTTVETKSFDESRLVLVDTHGSSLSLFALYETAMIRCVHYCTVGETWRNWRTCARSDSEGDRHSWSERDGE